MKPVIIIIVLFISILCLTVGQIALSNQVATTGTQLTEFNKQVEVYKKENIQLKEKLLEVSSLTTLDEKAKKLGFVPENTQIDLSAPLPLALNQ